MHSGVLEFGSDHSKAEEENPKVVPRAFGVVRPLGFGARALGEKLVDPLVLNLARAFRWQELIDSGTYSNAIELARAVGKDTAYVARTVRLTLLAPEIIHAILHGTLKKSISMETLRKSWPENWEEQKKYFGLI